MAYSMMTPDGDIIPDGALAPKPLFTRPTLADLANNLRIQSAGPPFEAVSRRVQTADGPAMALTMGDRKVGPAEAKMPTAAAKTGTQRERQRHRKPLSPFVLGGHRCQGTPQYTI
jgi:hypothetical protein